MDQYWPSYCTYGGIGSSLSHHTHTIISLCTARVDGAGRNLKQTGARRGVPWWSTQESRACSSSSLDQQRTRKRRRDQSRSFFPDLLTLAAPSSLCRWDAFFFVSCGIHSLASITHIKERVKSAKSSCSAELAENEKKKSFLEKRSEWFCQHQQFSD